MATLLRLPIETWWCCSRPSSFSLAEAQAHHLGQRDVGGHVGELLLRDLEARQGAVEDDALLGVAQGLVEAGQGRAHAAPGDAVARLGQAHEGAFRPVGVRQLVSAGTRTSSQHELGW
jgi:hypothetical protein